MRQLPSSTATFFFTDIEGSTAMWQARPAEMPAALDWHDSLLRRAIEAQGGRVFKSVGDGLCAVLGAPSSALAAAVRAQVSLASNPAHIPALRVRMAVHDGEVTEEDGDFRGSCLNVASRLLSSGHGGQILVSAVVAAMTTESLPDSLRLRDLGEHRLRDVQQPMRVFQVVGAGLEDAFPPLRTTEGSAHNLPPELNSSVGREDLALQVKGLVGSSRLLTLTGVGGVGKTRLALRVAAEALADYPDGAWFAQLPGIADAALIAPTIAATLGAREAPGRTIEATLVDHVREKCLLLVLDGCEHQIDACARVADLLPRGAGRLSIVATSREALNTAGGRPDLHAARWHSAGDRARRRAHPGAPSSGDCRSPRRPLRPADWWQPNGAATPADPGGGDRLELRATGAARASAVPSTRRVPRAMDASGGRGHLRG